MLSRSLSDFALLILAAVKRSIGGNATAEERPAAVAHDGAVVDVVIGGVVANLAANFPYKLGPFSLWFFSLAAIAARGRFVVARGVVSLRHVDTPGLGVKPRVPEGADGQHAFVVVVVVAAVANSHDTPPLG